MAQPILTYNLTWGTGNIYQKLSGKTYINPSGQRVDCSSVTVTFSSSQHFKKFYATAVKEGNDYGFIDDILVDIRGINPTGVLLYELTSRNANIDFNFTINVSSLTAGDGLYRIGLYVQNDDNIWNYEYFLVDINNNSLIDNQGNNLQVPVQTEINQIDLFAECIYKGYRTLTNKINGKGTDSNWFYSEPIEITTQKKISYYIQGYSTVASIQYYTDSMAILSNIASSSDLSTVQGLYQDIPQEAKYISVCCRAPNLFNGQYCIIE